MDCTVTDRVSPVAACGRCPHPTSGLSRRRLVSLIGTGLAAVGSLLQETHETTAKARHKKRKRRQRDEPQFPWNTQGNTQPLAAGPLGAVWREEVQFACGSGAEITPADPIGELLFLADGTLAVTWVPFEVYHDYFATYTADLDTQTLHFQVSRGNYIPPDVDGEGHIAFDAQGRLLLTDLWLGSPKTTAGSVGCGHRFRKAGS